MQADTFTPDTLAPENPYKEQLDYLKVAVWMVQFRNRYPAGQLDTDRYNAINRNLLEAERRAHATQGSIPGGTALRLAKAIWWFDYRLMYPDDYSIRRREENATAHLAYSHRNVNKNKNSPVWNGIERFIRLRTQTLGGIPVPANKKEDVFQPNPFTKALRHLDTFVTANKRLRRRLVFKEFTAAMATAHPDHKSLLVPVVQGARAYARWLVNPAGIVEVRDRDAGYEAILKAQNENGDHLRTNAPALNKAINALLYEMRKPLA